ncbi:MAG: ATP-binding protein [Methylococcaceae bacterium]
MTMIDRRTHAEDTGSRTPYRVKNSIRWKLLSALLGSIVILVVALTAMELALEKKILETELAHRIALMKENLVERSKGLSGLLLTQVENEVATFNFSQIQKLLKTAIDESPLLEYAILVNTEGRAFIDTLHPEREQEILNTEADRYALNQDAQTWLEYAETNSIEYILPIHFGATRWGVLRLGYTMQPLLQEIARSRAESVAITRELLLDTAAIAVVILLLGSGMVLVLSTTLTRPLVRLTESVRELGRGNYDQAARLITDSSETAQESLANQGEIGLLAAAFIDMANEVRHSQQALEYYNRTLEEKVRDRTLELEHAYDKLKELDEMKTRFLSTVSHELRTPLTSVLGFARIIQKKFESTLLPVIENNSDPKVRKAVRQVMDNTGIIVEEGERLTSLINDVLDLAKMEAGRMDWNFKKLAIEEIIDRAMSATSSLFADKPVEFVKEIAAELPLVDLDRDRLIQVVINLVSNAVKFTEKGQVTCRAISSVDELIVSVTDTGCGIKPEDQALVFEKFKQVGDTLTDKPKGTGLGLPICKEIIEHHKGTMWVESEPGVGSTFGFNLPLQLKPLDSESIMLSSEGEPIRFVWTTRRGELQNGIRARINQRHARRPDSNKTLLIIDDDVNIRQLLRQELATEAYNIIEAEGGEEGWTKTLEYWPDLIILDVRMPGLNGFSVAARLHAHPATLDIPIVLHTVAEDRRLADLLVIDRYFTKPVRDSRLKEEVTALLNRTRPTQARVLVLDSHSEHHTTWLEGLEALGHAVEISSDTKTCLIRAESFQPHLLMAEAQTLLDQSLVNRLRVGLGMEQLLFAAFEEDES